MSEQVSPGAFAVMQQDISDLKGLVRQVADTLAKFAVVEERQQQHAALQDRILSRVEAMEARQNKADIAEALSANHSRRIERLEEVAREFHVESERQKAKVGAFTWSMRMVWTAGLAIAGAVAWLIKHNPLIS